MEGEKQKALDEEYNKNNVKPLDNLGKNEREAKKKEDEKR